MCTKKDSAISLLVPLSFSLLLFSLPLLCAHDLIHTCISHAPLFATSAKRQRGRSVGSTFCTASHFCNEDVTSSSAVSTFSPEATDAHYEGSDKTREREGERERVKGKGDP